MQFASKDFWLYTLDQVEESRLKGLCGENAELLWNPRIRGRVNVELMRRFQLGVAFRPIQDPFLQKLALLDAAATRRLAWLASLCLARHFLQQEIGRERRSWVQEVVGEDGPFVFRRAALLWREEGEYVVPTVSCASDLRTNLLSLGRGAFVLVLDNAKDPELAERLMLRFPAEQASTSALLSSYQPSALRRLFEKLINL